MALGGLWIDPTDVRAVLSGRRWLVAKLNRGPGDSIPLLWREALPPIWNNRRVSFGVKEKFYPKHRHSIGSPSWTDMVDWGPSGP